MQLLVLCLPVPPMNIYRVSSPAIQGRADLAIDGQCSVKPAIRERRLESEKHGQTARQGSPPRQPFNSMKQRCRQLSPPAVAACWFCCGGVQQCLSGACRPFRTLPELWALT